MVNFEKYTKDTYDHVPRGYHEDMPVITHICEINGNCAAACAIDGWKLGFERAYRAAKAGRLDFQQQ